MANKKIHLTYLWADESVLREDLDKKISSQMTDWADAFFKRFEFELDIDPSPKTRATFAGAQKYALVKSQGVSPDLREPVNVYPQEHAWLNLYDSQFNVAKNAEAKSEQQAKDSEALARALKARFEGLERQRNAATDPADIQRLDAEIARVKGDLSAAEAQHRKDQEQRMAHSDAAHQAVRAWNAMFDQIHTKVDEAKGLHKLRAQMSLKFREHSIGSDKRVNVVFCRFRRGLSGLRMRPGPHGVTYPELVLPIYSFRDQVFLWQYPIIIVNLALDRTHVVAHEVVHATGRGHPMSLRIYKDKPVRGAAFTTVTRGSLGGGLPVSDIEIKMEYSIVPYEEIDGGYLEPDKDDIMSYAKEKRQPEKTNLSQKDKDALIRAPFVS